MCVRACVHVCACVCMCICVHVCMCMCVRLFVLISPSIEKFSPSLIFELRLLPRVLDSSSSPFKNFLFEFNRLLFNNV